MSDSSDPRIAWLSFGGAMVFAAAAILLRLGAVSLGTWIFLSVSVLLWSPWTFTDEPVIGVGWAAVLGAVALAVHVREPASRAAGEDERRWDLPPIAVGAVSTVLALWIAVLVDQIAITWTLAGVLVLATAFVVRSRWVAGLGAALVVVGAIDAGHGWGALALAGGAAGLAVIALREPERSTRAGLQVGSAALAAGSLIETVLYAGWSAQVACGVALLLAAASAVAAMTSAARHANSPWIAQLGWFSLAAQLLGTGAAVASLPERGPMVAALLTAAALAAAVGIVQRRLEALAASPVFATGAWLVGIGALIHQDPMWWAVPVGLAALSIAEIGRWWDRHREALGEAKSALLTLEYAGVAAALATPLVEIVTVASSRAIAAVLIGLVVAGWGMVTKVRRRLFIGAGGVVVAIVLVFGGQVAKLVPRITGAGMWVTLAVIGIVLVLIATSLERGRARIAAAIKRLDEIFADWE
jgi:hypothetical protein